MTSLLTNRAQVAHLVFDWNGTLLDDLDLAVECVQELCELYGVPPIDRDGYRRAFRFPIAEFYKSIGFDPAVIPLPELMALYLERFDARAGACPLRPGAAAFLVQARSAGLAVSVLSAAHHPTLIAAVARKDLDRMFDHVCGLGNDRADGKVAEAKALQARLGVPPMEVLYVGDTTHDIEVAHTLGWRCMILTGGHQDAAWFGNRPTHHVRDFADLAAELFGLGRQ